MLSPGAISTDWPRLADSDRAMEEEDQHGA